MFGSDVFGDLPGELGVLGVGEGAAVGDGQDPAHPSCGDHDGGGVQAAGQVRADQGSGVAGVALGGRPQRGADLFGAGLDGPAVRARTDVDGACAAVLEDQCVPAGHSLDTLPLRPGRPVFRSADRDPGREHRQVGAAAELLGEQDGVGRPHRPALGRRGEHAAGLRKVTGHDGALVFGVVDNQPVGAAQAGGLVGPAGRDRAGGPADSGVVAAAHTGDDRVGCSVSHYTHVGVRPAPDPARAHGARRGRDGASGQPLRSHAVPFSSSRQDTAGAARH
ncbi:hypothetical protein [Streptomyces sp. SID2888]|uniref:hypothetical protein n=1 Tax=Streptomyces sp. SID2888 TaxID=2690256 RepID=UPI001F26FF0C|nr:hypothetical protein [Streptomyces sp. SID2888]